MFKMTKLDVTQLGLNEMKEYPELSKYPLPSSHSDAMLTLTFQAVTMGRHLHGESRLATADLAYRVIGWASVHILSNILLFLIRVRRATVSYPHPKWLLTSGLRLS